MTLEEVIEQFGEVELKFNNVHKDIITYIGFHTDGSEIRMSVGDGFEAVEVHVDDVETLADWEGGHNGFMDMCRHVTIKSILGDMIYEYNDW